MARRTEELEGDGTVYSARIRDIQQQECIPAIRCIRVRGFGGKVVSGSLLGLLPIRSTDEGTEKSEDGELLTN